MDAAEYKHIVLGLISLKFVSGFIEANKKLLKEPTQVPDEYRAEQLFYVPQNARGNFIHSQSKLPTIGKYIDDAMDYIESLNPNLKSVLPKVYAQPSHASIRVYRKQHKPRCCKMFLRLTVSSRFRQTKNIRTG